MENNIEIFNNSKFGSIRAIEKDGKVWFVGIDVAEVLGYRNPRKTISTKIKGEHKISMQIQTNGGKQLANCIDEYSVILLVNDSKICSENTKKEFIDFLYKEKLIKSNIVFAQRKEVKFIELLEEFLSEYNIKGIKQYPVFNYRIDYYIPELKLAIEYDENDHKHYTYENQELRQLKIENELNCKFIRLSDSVSDIKNIAKVSKHLKDMEVKNE